jgi:hypothetical protein
MRPGVPWVPAVVQAVLAQSLGLPVAEPAVQLKARELEQPAAELAVQLKALELEQLIAEPAVQLRARAQRLPAAQERVAVQAVWMLAKVVVMWEALLQPVQGLRRIGIRALHTE